MPSRLQTSMAGALLHIPSVQLSDEGTYDCEALNSKGKDRHRTRLYVDGMSTAPPRTSRGQW